MNKKIFFILIIFLFQLTNILCICSDGNLECQDDSGICEFKCWQAKICTSPDDCKQKCCNNQVCANFNSCYDKKNSENNTDEKIPYEENSDKGGNVDMPNYQKITIIIVAIISGFIIIFGVRCLFKCKKQGKQQQNQDQQQNQNIDQQQQQEIDLESSKAEKQIPEVQDSTSIQKFRLHNTTGNPMQINQPFNQFKRFKRPVPPQFEQKIQQQNQSAQHSLNICQQPIIGMAIEDYPAVPAIAVVDNEVQILQIKNFKLKQATPIPLIYKANLNIDSAKNLQLNSNNNNAFI